jgi:hypothetical protein
MLAPVTSGPSNDEPAELVAGARPWAAPARPGEGGKLRPQEVLKDEVTPPAHHAAEPREHEAEGLGLGPRMADLT